jgi:spermidine/putrescine-binding protein
MEMSGNIRNFLSSSAASAVEVGVGDAAYGVAIDTYGQAQAGYYGKENVTFTLPEGQTVITPDSIAILKNPPHPELARHFLEFVLSREGQLLWMLPKGSPGGSVRYDINRMSVRPALYDELAGVTPILTDPFKLHSDFVYSNQLGSKRRAILSVLIAAWMIDTHDALVPAWKAVNSPAALKLSDRQRLALLARLVAPPCTEAELLHLADTDWKDPVKRTALINRWQSEALTRDKSVLAQIPGN